MFSNAAIFGDFTSGTSGPYVGGVTSGSSDAAAVPLTTPTCAVGDLLVACWATENLTRTPQLPTGWAWLYQGDSTNMRYRVLTKTADSGDAAGGSHSFALNSYGVDLAIVFLTVRDTSGLDVYDLDVITGGTAYTVTPGVDPSQANNLLLHGSIWRGTTTYTAPSTPGTWTEEAYETGVPNARVAVSSSPYAADTSTGDVTATIGASLNGAAVLMSFAPL